MGLLRHLVLSIILLLTSVSLLIANTKSGKPKLLKVVTSFSILEDLTRELGGPYIKITNLVGKNSDGHLYQPRPSDAVAVANADLVIFNGLGFEGWMKRLIESASFKGVKVEASNGVDILYNGDEMDPHAWQSLMNIKKYATNISKVLISSLPEKKNRIDTTQ